MNRHETAFRKRPGYNVPVSAPARFILDPDRSPGRASSWFVPSSGSAIRPFALCFSSF